MNSSSKHYLSFNASNAGSPPLAESTAIGMPRSPYESFRGNQKRKTVSPLSNSSKQRLLGPTQIESHILTNAQSRGIVKRLVNYYDESQNEAEKNKFVYNRVGDFPLIQLKKTEIKRNLVRSSSVRIAPPSKTIMNRDIRAAILRSNSFQLGANVPKLLPTKMRAKEDDAHQIITNHDPLPIHESPQTAKSVLDALEKNCRKRINNEELTMDRNKRICATSAQPEVVDSPSPREFVSTIQQSSKRGREQVSPPNKLNDSPSAQMRKRMRTKNNALLSSLSSSHYVLKPFTQSHQQSIMKPFTATSTVTQNSKPLDEIERQEKQMKEVSISSDKSPTIPESLPKPQNEKRLYLFNARVDPTKRRVLADDDDEPKINFVKPRENPQHSDIDILRHVEKQKLSIMLSGLSDGFKSPGDEIRKDFVDAPASVSISFTTSTTSSTVAPISAAVSAVNAKPSDTGSNALSSLLKPIVSTAAITSIGSGFSLIPSVATTSSGSLLNSTTTTSTSAIVTTSIATSIATTSSIVGAVTSEPAKSLVGFQFGATTTSPDASTKTTFSMPTGMNSLLTPSTKPTESSIDANKSLMSFTPIAKTTVVPSSSAAITTTSTAPVLGGFGLPQPKETTTGGFSFGTNTISNGFGSSNVIPSTTSTVPATSAPSFSFNTPATTAAFSFGAKPLETAITTTAPAFGSNSIAPISDISGNLGSTVSFIQKPQAANVGGFSFNSTLPAAPVATTSSGFSFNATGNTSVPATANPMKFGSGNSAFGQPTATTLASSNPIFGQPLAPSTGFSDFNQKPQAPQQASGMFSFGQTAATPVTTTNTATPSTFSFGGSNQTPVVTQPASGFSFGQSNPIQSPPKPTSSIFSRLGDAQPDPKAAFSFGGSSQPAPQPSMSSPFGASNNALATNSTPIFGASNNSTFNKPSNISSPNNVFGNTATNTANNTFASAAKPFSFGASTSNQPQQQQTAQPPAAAGMFSFGGNSTSTMSTSPQSQSNVFGSTIQMGSPNQQNVSASFTFKPSNGAVTNNSTSNVFGQAQNSSSAPPPAYQFGNSQIGNNVSASFTFGGSSSNIAQTSQPIPTQSAGFNFGGPQSAPVAGNGFNFQGAQPSLTPQPSSSGGMFNIGTGGNQQQRRPIRQATRRMK